MTLKDCPSCGTTVIRDAVRVCGECQLAERYEARTEKAEARVAELEVALQLSGKALEEGVSLVFEKSKRVAGLVAEMRRASHRLRNGVLPGRVAEELDIVSADSVGTTGGRKDDDANPRSDQGIAPAQVPAPESPGDESASGRPAGVVVPDVRREVVRVDPRASEAVPDVCHWHRCRLCHLMTTQPSEVVDRCLPLVVDHDWRQLVEACPTEATIAGGYYTNVPCPVRCPTHCPEHRSYGTARDPKSPAFPCASAAVAMLPFLLSATSPEVDRQIETYYRGATERVAAALDQIAASCLAEARSSERSRIVAWLRLEAAHRPSTTSQRLLAAASAIEEGASVPLAGTEGGSKQ